MWSENTQPLLILPMFPTLSQVSAFFRLCQEQHRMFIIAGCKVITNLSSQAGLSVSENIGNVGDVSPDDQLLAFLSGGAGYGKSEVIKALQTLAEYWNSPGAVMTCSFTGIASVKCRAETLHTLFNLNL